MRFNIALSILLLLLLLGCVSYNPPEQKNETVNPPPVVELQCSQIVNRDDGDRCYYNDAIEKNNLIACSFIFSDVLRDNCNLRFAVNLTDPALCARIANGYTRDDCYHTIAPMAGIMTCNKIENDSLRKKCRLELGDESVLCEGMSANYDYNLCMAKSKNNYSICNEITNHSFWDDCYFDFAKAKSNYKICGLLSSSGGRDSCFQYFANLTSNSSLCENISFSYTRYLCITRLTGDYARCNELSDYLQKDSCFKVFASEHTAPNLCLNISTHLYQDACFTDIAMKSKDASICSRMICYECINDREDCYMKVANATSDPSPCGKITDSMKGDLCYLTVAKTSSNPSYCSPMQNNYRRNTCYSSVIYGQSFAPSMCADINYTNWKDECYQKIAISSKNSTLCQNIADPFVKSKCIEGSS
ncbi:hypothetical protein H0N98_05090 [Candidatus Micrarchaeota archaeon]|nr:hypothetical protein [Candidatus Micrarchaeota archaeon]